MEGDIKKQIYLDPKKISVPLLVLIGVVGWIWNIINTQNNKEFQINSAILLNQQQDIRQDSDIVKVREDIKNLTLSTTNIKDQQTQLQIEIANRLTSIETALGIKKK